MGFRCTYTNLDPLAFSVVASFMRMLHPLILLKRLASREKKGVLRPLPWSECTFRGINSSDHLSVPQQYGPAVVGGRVSTLVIHIGLINNVS